MLALVSRFARQPLKVRRVACGALVRQTIDELADRCEGRAVEFAVGDDASGAPRVAYVRTEALDFLFAQGAYAGRDTTPGLVLLDLKLPKVDGLEVPRAMKEHPRTRTIPVVMLTSSKGERDIVGSYRLGVNSYICKPVEFMQFAEAVRRVGLYWLLLNESMPQTSTGVG